MAIIKHYRWGGFVISIETAIDWAARITGKTFMRGQFCAIEQAIQPEVRPFNAGFELIEDSRDELAFMVITQSERLMHFEKDRLVPPFTEGERETMAKPLLEREGVTNYVFKTVRTGIRVA